MHLSEVLLSRVGEARGRIAAVPGLDERLAGALAKAQQAWPGLALTDERFLLHFAEKLAEEPDPVAALGGLCVADLFFACACASGDPAAIAAFETRFMPRAASHFARNGSLAPHADELMQLVRMRLLVADGVDRPRIAEYSGRAPFGGWFSVVVKRIAIDYTDKHKLDPAGNAEKMPASPEPDPELEYLRIHHQGDLDAAFKEALASLPLKTANLLRLFYLEGVSADSAGALYGVTERSIHRLIARARSRIMRDTESRLGAKLNLTVSQVGTLIAIMRSQVDVSLHRFLGRPKG